MRDLNFNAVIFDLDGVITDTASVHSAAWKQMFDEFLQKYAQENNIDFQEFTHENDYLRYVDGKPRYQGVISFLAARGIELLYGDPGDGPDVLTICGLGNRKNEIFNNIIRAGNVQVYQSTVDLIHQLRAAGVRVGVASSSKNAGTVLGAVGLLDLIETRVDGIVSAELGLMGKPQPDIFITACDNLGAAYDRAVVVEDAISGVQAGQNGGFGLVLGIAREGNAHELKANGADIVVEDLGEISLSQINDWFTSGLVDAQWSIQYDDYQIESEGTRETLLTVGNGYFGTRGALEETSANQTNYPGTYIAGLYNRLESQVGGRVVSNEDFVNCPNWLPITFKLADGDWFDPNQSQIKEISRRLDFRTGVLRRSMIVVDSAGRETRLESQRLASMAEPHLAALRYQITPLNYSETITIRSTIDGDIINDGVARYRDLSARHLEPVAQAGAGDLSSLLVKTNQSNVLIAEVGRLFVSVDQQAIQPEYAVVCTPGKAQTDFAVAIPQKAALTIDKVVSIFASHQEQVTDPLAAAKSALSKASDFNSIKQTSTEAWERIWEQIDIEIEGDRVAQRLIRLHLYHTVVTMSPHNRSLDAGLPARGLHGEAYRGHIFWDELYIQPFFNLHFPEAARAALMYRCRRLDAARQSAREHGYQGAMFPWQSGSSGGEETQTLHLNPLSGEWGADHSILQRHVGLAVAYNIWGYLSVTEDQDFLDRFGAEAFFEICRFWASKASLNESSERYEIAQVMGPDEFHEKYPGALEGGLKNNSYTNILVAWAFRRANDLLSMMSADARDALMDNIRLSEAELVHWQDIALRLTIPLSEEGVLEQYEGYFELEELDWEYYSEKYGNIHRMDRILKAEGKSPDAYKVAKQADALMAFYTLSEDQIKGLLQDLGYAPPENLLAANFSYYLERTSHGSTLSRLVHAYLAHKLADLQLAWRLYMEALKSDFVDIQGGTTKEGIHLGVMTGTVVFSLRAFAGINFDDSFLRVSPDLPAHWRSMRFRLGFKGTNYQFLITPKNVQVKIDGKAVKQISIYGRACVLQPGNWHLENRPENWEG